jgi:ferrous iron transport protein B
MATRNIGSSRDRWITNFIIPLMSCSARLPVYSLLLGFLFLDKEPWKAGFALASLYMGSVFVGAVAAAILNKILAKTQKSFFMMELPIYRKPHWKALFKQTITRTKAYVKRAGPAILVFAVLIWFGTTFPNFTAEGPERLQSSYMAQIGQSIEPLFKPMGVDWRVGVGLISAFAAREVFVSSMAVMFNITDEETQEQGMLEAMKTATDSSGAMIFTPATVVGLLIFFMIALQCMSTVAIQMKENQSKYFAIMQLVVFNVVAYVLAVVAVQGLRALGVA